MPVQADWQQRHEDVRNEFNKCLDPLRARYLLFDQLMDPWTETVTSWSGFLAWLEELEGNWCFRGQRKAARALTCTLDRGVQVRTRNSCYHLNLRDIESDLLFQFQQQAHQYIANLPAPEDKVSWHALMQHHGVPTRLLDWTLSPYVALFFAIEKKPQETNDKETEEVKNDDFSAVWAIDRDWLKEKIPEELKQDSASGQLIYFDSSRDWPNKESILEVIPQKVNQRMTAQQGILLMKLVADHPRFDEILAGMLKRSQTEMREPVIRKLKIHKDFRLEFLQNLRKMNIHHGTLFPGLDGFCQSLKTDLEIKVAQEKERGERDLIEYERSHRS